MKQQFITHKHTLYGVAAILLWGSLMALTRRVAEEFSPIGGAALIYTVSTLFLLFAMGMPRLKAGSSRYILIGGALVRELRNLPCLSTRYGERSLTSDRNVGD